MIIIILSVAFLLVLGFLIVFLRNKTLEISKIKNQLITLQIENAKLETSLMEQNKSFVSKLALIDESKERLKDVVKGISADALEKMEAKSSREEDRRGKVLSELVNPMKESLSKLSEKLAVMEKDRKVDKESLSLQMKQMVESEKTLLKETVNLKDALSKPEIRGLWGELQLKRVIEISGMLNYCDFLEQNVEETESGRIRPDVTIKLSEDRCIIVDSKAPFEGFLRALATDDMSEKQEQIKRHARHLRNHIQMLSKKKYYEGFTNTPEFVVLFLPSEVFFSSAMQVDPTLLEYGASLGVILATPTTLIGLLRAVAYGWKNEAMTTNAKLIQSLGMDLYKRLHDMSKHLTSLGKSLNMSVDAYNKTIGTFERRVLSSARKFNELGASSHDVVLSPFEPIDNQIRSIQSLELDEDEVSME